MTKSYFPRSLSCSLETRKKCSLETRKKYVGFTFTLPAVLYFAIVFVYPFLTSIFMSFFEWSPLGSKFIGTQAYQFVLNDPTFWYSVKNSLYLMCLSVPGTVLLALVISVLLYTIKKDRPRHIFNIIYL